MIPFLFPLALAAPAATTIPADYQCEYAGRLPELGDATFSDPEAPIVGVVFVLICPEQRYSTSTDGDIVVTTEDVPRFFVVDDETAQQIVDDANDILASDGDVYVVGED